MQSVPGTWGIGGYNLPDYGVTEWLRQYMGKRPSAEVTTTFNNPAVYQSIGVNTAPVQNKPVINAPTKPFIPLQPHTTASAPTNTQQNNPVSNEVALAEAARRNRINSYKAQAQGIRNQAQSSFDDILKAVNAFRDRSKTLYSNAGQEITNRASSILGSNARTAQETMGEARARGRALGLGDSSRFINQNKIAGNLATTQGNTLARRGEEERSNSAQFQERQDQAQTQEDQANTYLRSARDRATQIETSGYDASEEQFANSLNDIVSYQRSLAAINPAQAGELTQYTPNFSGIVNTINNVLSGMKGNSQTTEDSFANPVNPTDIFSLLKQKRLVF